MYDSDASFVFCAESVERDLSLTHQDGLAIRKSGPMTGDRRVFNFTLALPLFPVYFAVVVFGKPQEASARKS